jgi:Gas vesicle protein
MTEADMVQSGAGAPQSYRAASVSSGRTSANLGDILERILDKGLVIAGDIQVNLLDIELLTIKLRLVIASLETAKEVGINWWENDPWLSADASRRAEQREKQHELGERDLVAENHQLRTRVRELESGGTGGTGGNGAKRERRGT